MDRKPQSGYGIVIKTATNVNLTGTAAVTED